MTRNAESRFSHLPAVDIPRSKYFIPFQHKTTFNAGELIPIFHMEVLPGDTFSMDMASLIRMSTPIFPTMDNAYLDTYFFFVPNRLVWEHWKEFNGENTQSYWAQSVEYEIPQITSPVLSDGPDGDARDSWDKGSLADYFGIPTNVSNLSVTALPFRAYTLIWNEWFRDQNTMAPAYFYKGDATLHGHSRAYYTYEDFGHNSFSDRVNSALYGGCPLPVAKYHDYFTSCLPAPQKGPAVDLPLYRDNIPVFAGDVRNNPPSLNSLSYTPFQDGQIYDDSQFGNVVGVRDLGDHVFESSLGDAQVSFYPQSNVYLAPNNLYADVSQVAVATISQLRQAFQLQKLYEKDARGGTRYTEILKAHFGVDSPDARQQRPEYLGGKRIPINIDQVLQTSQTTSVSPQGNTAAYSMTSDVSNSFTKSFTEHGYIIGVCCVRTEHTYQQGIERMWSRRGRFDFYWPALANISEQAVLVKEIFAEGTDSDNDAFGYQEAWADYRYKPSRVSGAFRSNYDQSLDAWHYADYYDGSNSEFVLNGEWLAETPVNIDRTLAVSSSVEDQFIADFYFKLDAVRPMPLFSIPGLVDHH